MQMTPQELASLPLWLAGLLLVAGAVAGALLCGLVVRRFVPPPLRRQHATIGSAMFNVVGTTYAVLLAFVAMLAWEGFSKAQAMTDQEASMVQNVYQLVLSLDGAEAAGMRHDIVAYAQAVVRSEWPAQAHGREVDEQEPNLAHLVQTAFHLHPATAAEGTLHATLLTELAQLSTLRQARLLAARTSIPFIMWLGLIAGGGLTVAFASLLGAPDLRMQVAMTSLLALSGALVLLVIVALSNPFRGDLGISNEPFQRVLTHMSAA